MKTGMPLTSDQRSQGLAARRSLPPNPGTPRTPADTPKPDFPGRLPATVFQLPCKPRANMPPETPACGCQRGRHAQRIFKQLPRVAIPCRRVRRVRAPSSPPFLPFIFYSLRFSRAHRANMLACWAFAKRAAIHPRTNDYLSHRVIPNLRGGTSVRWKRVTVNRKLDVLVHVPQPLGYNCCWDAVAEQDARVGIPGQDERDSGMIPNGVPG
jgi:hypothetical protein